MICSIEWCGKKVLGRGWCAAHYAKWRKYGDPRAVHVHIRPRCSVSGCREFHHAKGFCANHYAAQAVRAKKPRAPRRSLGSYLSNRIEFSEGCWTWTGHLHLGYGRVYFQGLKALAHRVVYEQVVGPIPEGLVLDHLCRQTSCVNPRHLEPVTNAENVLRGVGAPAQNARKTHCKWGHPFEGENVIRRPDGRECRTCARENQRASELRKRLNEDHPNVRWVVQRTAEPIEPGIYDDLVVLPLSALAGSAS